jgi:hypothetical protein
MTTSKSVPIDLDPDIRRFKERLIQERELSPQARKQALLKRLNEIVTDRRLTCGNKR